MELKLTPNLALGYAELKFLQQSMIPSLLKQLVERYGIIRKSDAFEELKIIQGSGGTVSIQAGVAIDSELNIISVPLLENELEIASDNIERHVVLKFKSTTIETGKVNIQQDGTMEKVVIEGAGFTERLRGIGAFPSKVRFPGSINNTGEYFVRSVVSDNTVLLNVGQSVLIPEENVEWEVVGSFTPSIVIPDEDKAPFVQDSYSIELRDSPTLIAGSEFLLASIIRDQSQLTITDQRDSHTLKLYSSLT